MGAKRKALVEEFGYDCKNAAHLIRLLRIGTEFLLTGELSVYRGDIDADILIQIKRGDWPIEAVLDESEHEFSKLETAYERSTLPEKANTNSINRLLVEILSLAKSTEVTMNMVHVLQDRPSVYS